MANNFLKPIIYKNGLTLLRLPRPQSNLVVVGFVVKTGSSVELDNFPAGISYLIEKMFWKGTDKHPSIKSLNQALEGMGGDYYSFTGRETTHYYIRVPASSQFKAISMLAEVIQHSYFQPFDLDNEKQKLIEKVKFHQEELLNDTVDLSIENMYENSGIGQSQFGSVESVLTITGEHIIEYLAHQYSPKNCYLVLSGNFETKSSLELMEQEWALWSPRSLDIIKDEEFDPIHDQKLPKLEFRQRGLPKIQIALGFALDGGLEPIFNSEDYNNNDKEAGVEVARSVLNDWARLIVLNTLLGQGLSSRLWLKCVEEEMFFESITSQIILFAKTGYLHIGGTAVDNSQFTFALESILVTLEAIKKTTISITEFTKAKELAKSRLIIENEDLLLSTIWQMETTLLSGLTINKEDLIESILEVDLNGIRSLAMDLFVPDRAVVSTLGTARQSSVITKLIKKYLQS
jgi:predicted Zn-dependent peptidase